jgi:hypothetical protein
MKGVQFVIDEHGTKTAVVINLNHYRNFGKIFTTAPLRRLEKMSRESRSHLLKNG